MFLEELTKLVTDISWIVILLLIIGFILCFVEAIIPNFGIVGIAGILFEIAGIVLHGILSGSILQVFIIVLIVLVVLSLAIVVFVRSAKYGILGKSALVENKTAIPVDYNEQENNDYSVLIGEIGEAVSDCKPIGKMKFKQGTYDVLSKSDFILAGETAEVVDVVGNNIYVEKIKGENK